MKEAYLESEAGCSLNTDEELYARFLCGEDDAIRQLMDRYLDRLTLFCFTFLHSLTEAEDMALDSPYNLYIHPGLPEAVPEYPDSVPAGKHDPAKIRKKA